MTVPPRLFDRPGPEFGAWFQVWADTFLTQLEEVPEIQAALGADITTAQNTATAAIREAARINSYTVPTNLLSATDAGSDASIAVAGHTRVYPVQGTVDVDDVVILAGSITGLAFTTEYHVYYDDTTLADTTPAFLATTDQATAQVGAAAGRHFVGTITTPADGGGGTTGTGPFPPGGGGGNPIP